MKNNKDNIIHKLNNSTVLAKSVKNAINDSYKFKLKNIRVKNYNKLIKNNTQRKKELRKKYRCLLESDIKYLTNIFSKVRRYFSGIPMPKNSEFINGGLYINILPPKGRKTEKFYVINFRFKSDLEYVEDIKTLLESHGFKCSYDYKVF
jgi:hypothetical protein